MAKRPVFVPASDGEQLISIIEVEFEWHAGRSLQQKQRSINSLHASASMVTGWEVRQIMEVSSKSSHELGRALSALNLTFITLKKGREYCVESAYQASKVFRARGDAQGTVQHKDLILMPGREARRDPRLKNSGDLLFFSFCNQHWPLEPAGAFYSWLYINALLQSANRGLVDGLSRYSGFTDIEFNPAVSFSSQAAAVALFVSLQWRGLLSDSLRHREAFLEVMHKVPSAHTGKSRRSIRSGASCAGKLLESPQLTL